MIHECAHGAARARDDVVGSRWYYVGRSDINVQLIRPSVSFEKQENCEIPRSLLARSCVRAITIVSKQKLLFSHAVKIYHKMFIFISRDFTISREKKQKLVPRSKNNSSAWTSRCRRCTRVQQSLRDLINFRIDLSYPLRSRYLTEFPSVSSENSVLLAMRNLFGESDRRKDETHTVLRNYYADTQRYR